MSQPFPPTALRRRHTQTVRVRSSSYKIDYVKVIKNFRNPKGHQNPISCLEVRPFYWRGGFCLSVELQRGRVCPAACAAGLFTDVWTYLLVASSRASIWKKLIQCCCSFYNIVLCKLHVVDCTLCTEYGKNCPLGLKCLCFGLFCWSLLWNSQLSLVITTYVHVTKM